jgi:hypothetical protein
MVVVVVVVVVVVERKGHTGPLRIISSLNQLLAAFAEILQTYEKATRNLEQDWTIMRYK